MAELLSHIRPGEMDGDIIYVDGQVVISLTQKEANFLRGVMDLVNAGGTYNDLDYRIWRALGPVTSPDNREKFHWSRGPSEYPSVQCIYYGDENV